MAGNALTRCQAAGSRQGLGDMEGLAYHLNLRVARDLERLRSPPGRDPGSRGRSRSARPWRLHGVAVALRRNRVECPRLRVRARPPRRLLPGFTRPRPAGTAYGRAKCYQVPPLTRPISTCAPPPTSACGTRSRSRTQAPRQPRWHKPPTHGLPTACDRQHHQQHPAGLRQPAEIVGLPDRIDPVAGMQF